MPTNEVSKFLHQFEHSGDLLPVKNVGKTPTDFQLFGPTGILTHALQKNPNKKVSTHAAV